MKYYLDGKLVDVAASNIWNIEEIPSFTFEIENKGIEVEEVGSVTSKRKSEKKLNDTVTLSSMTVLGATNQASAYTLYRFDESKADITVDEEDFEKALVSVAFKTIKTEALKLLNEVGEGKIFLSGQGKGKLLCIVRHVATDNALNVLAFRERQAHFGEVGRWFIHPLVHHLHPDVGLADILRSPFQRIVPNGLTVLPREKDRYCCPGGYIGVSENARTGV